MDARNCWEYKKCGREPGGVMAEELGVCPSSTEERVDGFNSGKNAGRVCWVIPGTMCEGIIQGTFIEKFNECASCEFYQAVKEEEGQKFIPTIVALKKCE